MPCETAHLSMRTQSNHSTSTSNSTTSHAVNARMRETYHWGNFIQLCCKLYTIYAFNRLRHFAFEQWTINDEQWTFEIDNLSKTFLSFVFSSFFRFFVVYLFLRCYISPLEYFRMLNAETDCITVRVHKSKQQKQKRVNELVNRNIEWIKTKCISEV